MNNNIYDVHMHAFHDPVVIRQVDITPGLGEVEPSQSELLELIFKYGQNDFQPLQDRYSVSVNDVVELHDGSLHMVGGMGFFPISRETLEKLPARVSARVMFPKDEQDVLDKLEGVPGE